MDTEEAAAQTEEMRAEDEEKRLLRRVVANYIGATGCSQRELARRAGLSYQWVNKFLGPRPRGQLTLFKIKRLGGAMNLDPFSMLKILGVSFPGTTENGGSGPERTPVLQQLVAVVQLGLPVEQQWALVWAARALREQQVFSAKPNLHHPRCRTCGLRAKPSRLFPDGQCERCARELRGPAWTEVAKPVTDIAPDRTKPARTRVLKGARA